MSDFTLTSPARRARDRSHRREFNVTLRLKADREVSAADLREFLLEMQWMGGCRVPGDDPLFTSVTIMAMTVTEKHPSK